jgi:lysophospholipase L1-like esterase
MRKNLSISKIVPAILILCSVAGVSAAPIAIQDGQTIAFLGDSITEGGWGNPVGYVRLVVAGLATNGIEVKPLPAGISGHKSDQMLARLRRDVLDKKPDWMTLSCGVNDVWHGEKGVPLDLYKNNIGAIIDLAQEAGVKVMLLTSTPIGENLGNANNQKLAAYNEFLRQKAVEKNCLLADLSADFHAKLRDRPPNAPGNTLTTDGVHMNAAGNVLMARGVLRAFGLDAGQLWKASEVWKDIPEGGRMNFGFKGGSTNTLQASFRGTLREREKLEALALGEGKSVDALLQAIFTEEARKFLKPGGEFADVQAIFDASAQKRVQTELQKNFTARVRELLKR